MASLAKVREALIYKSLSSYNNPRLLDYCSKYPNRVDEFCDRVIDDCVIIKKKKYKWYVNLFFCLVFPLLVGLFYYYFNIDILDCLLISSFTTLNLDFVYSKRVLLMLHKFYIKKNYKIKQYKNSIRTGYSFVFVGISEDDPDTIVIASSTNPPRITLINPKIYIMTKRSKYSVLVNYLHEEDSTDLDHMCKQLYSLLYNDMKSYEYFTENDDFEKFTAKGIQRDSRYY